MSSIPPNVVGPILQSGLTQKQASRILENEREQQEAATESANKLNDKLNVVGETDNDTQVNTDAEGAGSEGKLLAGDEDQALENPQPDSDGGITRDDDGQLHVDLEA